jgi:UDP-N-acetyl-D-mannosaminuronic acid dehydrogenase
LVILRSTVPVGTTRQVVLPILEQGSGLCCGEDFQLAFAPERTIEGNALKELRTLPQIVAGFDERSEEVATHFFGKIAPNIIRVNSLEAAEIAKLINNAFRDVSFAFANELAVICDQWNLDAVHVIEAANMGYPRNPIPLPSPGVGGLCLTKDPFIYAWAGREKGYDPILPIWGRRINTVMVNHVAHKVLNFFKRHSLSPVGRKVFIMGFAFKGNPETSDMRHSPTLDLLSLLQKADLRLFGHDPVVPAPMLKEFNVTPSGLKDGFYEADAVIVMTNHDSYKNLDLFGLLPGMRRPGLFFDGWHAFVRKDIEQIHGIEYEGLSGAH